MVLALNKLNIYLDLMQTMSLAVFLFDPTDEDFLRFVFFPLQHRKFTQESNNVFEDISHTVVIMTPTDVYMIVTIAQLNDSDVCQ